MRTTSPAGIAIRDSKDPDGGILALDATAWGALLGDIKDGRLNLPA